MISDKVLLLPHLTDLNSLRALIIRSRLFHIFNSLWQIVTLILVLIRFLILAITFTHHEIDFTLHLLLVIYITAACFAKDII